MTTARNNRRRKAKATKRLAAWKLARSFSATGKQLDQWALVLGARRQRNERDDKLRRRLVAIVRPTIYGGLAGEGLSWPRLITDEEVANIPPLTPEEIERQRAAALADMEALGVLRLIPPESTKLGECL
jgi:hypothetical protein